MKWLNWIGTINHKTLIRHKILYRGQTINWTHTHSEGVCALNAIHLGFGYHRKAINTGQSPEMFESILYVMNLIKHLFHMIQVHDCWCNVNQNGKKSKLIVFYAPMISYFILLFQVQ